MSHVYPIAKTSVFAIVVSVRATLVFGVSDQTQSLPKTPTPATDHVAQSETAIGALAPTCLHRGTSLMRKRPAVGPYGRPMPGVLWRS